MFKEFSVINIVAEMRDKSIRIDFSHDINEKSVNDNTIQIINRTTREIVDYDFSVSENIVSIILHKWAEPNIEYIIKIENIENVVGEKIARNERKKIIFDSSVSSTVNIISPADNEILDAVVIKWEELKKDDSHEFVNSFYIEISSDSSFYNVNYDAIVSEKTIVEFPLIEKGQYFVRCRAQKEQYGHWSDTITFNVGESHISAPDVYVPEQEEPIFIDDLNIISSPVSGTTPVSFFIELDADIDETSLLEILIIRKDY